MLKDRELNKCMLNKWMNEWLRTASFLSITSVPAASKCALVVSHAGIQEYVLVTVSPVGRSTEVPLNQNKKINS